MILMAVVAINGNRDKGRGGGGSDNGGKGDLDTKGTGEWVSIWYTHRAKFVESVGSIVIHVLHAGIFLLDADMKLVFPFCSPVAIWSM
jgi:hypothetical protein